MGDLKPSNRLFYWHGLDGSAVLAHIPYNKTFSRELNVAEINNAARDYPDDALSARSLISFGWGDGGGGPTPVMIEIVSRLANLQAAAPTVMRSPSRFFTLVEADLHQRTAATWEGELYFSRHRGTYTSQAETKKRMRKAEIALHDLEFIATIAFKLGFQPYPQAEINRLWKTVLLNQFHDILPGTSIQMVHEEANQQLKEVETQCRKLASNTLLAFAGESLPQPEQTLKSGSTKSKQQGESGEPSPAAQTSMTASTATKERNGTRSALAPVNTLAVNRYEVVDTPNGDPVFIEAPSYGFGQIVTAAANLAAVTIRDTNGLITLENEHLLAEFDHKGTLLRLFDKAAEREALSEPSNRLQIYDDYPVDYDAWEIEHFHQETEKDCAPAESYKTQGSALRGEIIFERKIGSKSTMKQTVRLNARARRLEFHCQIDWHEERKLLKVLFATAVRASNATYETQFGAVERPTHYNTAFDQARFEVVGHKWADLLSMALALPCCLTANTDLAYLAMKCASVF